MTLCLSRKTLIILAGFGSAAVLLAAFGFQYIGGLHPCVMCLWQRWPHAVVIGVAIIGAFVPLRIIAAFGALGMMGNAGLALYHTGVERDWWLGPQTCGQSGAEDVTSLSAAALLDTATGPNLVLCNQIAWEFLGLSMASWNGVICLGLSMIWAMAACARS
jgi:disulfide bond formation protein DsbB